MYIQLCFFSFPQDCFGNLESFVGPAFVEVRLLLKCGLVFLFLQQLCLLIGAFSLFTFKVINDRYVLIAIFVICFLDVFAVLCLFFFNFSPYGLMIFFSGMLVFLFLYFLCIL